MTPEEVERELRREWWLNHGHDYYSLYGDDGEMQCASCIPFGGMDFKRQPLDELREVVRKTRLERAARAMNGVTRVG